MRHGNNIMHVLNGDSTLIGFKESGIPGKTVVWREVFRKALLENILSDDFGNCGAIG
jgi:hypothetical protein